MKLANLALKYGKWLVFLWAFILLWSLCVMIKIEAKPYLIAIQGFLLGCTVASALYSWLLEWCFERFSNDYQRATSKT